MYDVKFESQLIRQAIQADYRKTLRARATIDPNAKLQAWKVNQSADIFTIRQPQSFITRVRSTLKGIL